MNFKSMHYMNLLRLYSMLLATVVCVFNPVISLICITMWSYASTRIELSGQCHKMLCMDKCNAKIAAF